ncbi:tyrosine-type recombinase/integrase [Thalassotalea piscium]|uniref:tyrosine-type recombinase/integrase n=1 Tax=Thalassotalea piscium TaxID=1230533 RepID=UPI0031EC25C2
MAQEWLKARKRNIENPQIPERVYTRDIRPYIGKLPVDIVTSRDIYDIVQRINDSGRPTVANDALDHCKHLFTQAIILNEIKNNPAAVLTLKHAGGTEKSRTRNLSFEEIEVALRVMRENKDQFTRENCIAVCLLLSLGVRKCELIAAPWSEQFLSELKVRAFDSEYLFPARRTSKRRSYISDDTLNHALGTLFGVPTTYQKKKKIQPYGRAKHETFYNS